MRKRSRPSAQVVGCGIQKRRKQKGENFKSLPSTSVQVMEHVLDTVPNPSLQVADKKSNLQAGNTADIQNQRDLSQASEANSGCLKLITYSRRSERDGHKHKGREKASNSSSWSLQKNGFCNNNSSTVESSETSFGTTKNRDTSFGEGSLVVDGKQNGSVKKGKQAGPTSKVSTDDSNNKKTRRRRRKKNKTIIHAKQISVSGQKASGSMNSGNIDSMKNIDLHPKIRSQSEMKKNNKINQMISTNEERNGLQMHATIVAVNESDLTLSPKYTLTAPVVKYTYSKRDRIPGQQGKDPRNSSYSKSQVNENDHCDRSLSVLDVAEAGCERNENDNASFSKNFLHVNEKDGGYPIKNMQTTLTSLISSDISSKSHEVNRIHPERIRKPRGRRKRKNKPPTVSKISEKDMSGSMKSEIIDSAERSDVDPEICSKSDMGNVNTNSGETHARRKDRAKKETPTVSKDDSLDSAQLCDAHPQLLEHKSEDLCQLNSEMSIEEKSNSKDEEKCPYSSVKYITDDVTSDATMKEDVTLGNMTISVQRASISCGKKKLLVLDLNGLLVDVTYERHPVQRAPIRVSGKSVYKRPFCDKFLEFCFERFDVGIWSSRQRKNIDPVVNFLFGEKRSQLLFCWDLSKCTTTGFNTLENVHKPLVLKELKKLWNEEDKDLPWEKGDYSSSNTLLIDDSPYKALCNPPYTAIFPGPYDHRNENDNALGLEGDLRVYLERLAMANNVQSYVKEHPFGQHAITPGDPFWGFYLQIIEKMNLSSASACSHDGVEES